MARPATSTSRLLAGSREPVRVATTGNIDPAAGGLLTIDGVTVEPGDRVLVKDQTDKKLNGIYGASAGEWYRASDGRSPRAINKGVTVHVAEGTVHEGQTFAFLTPEPEIGTDEIVIGFFLSYDTVGDAETEIEGIVEDATTEIGQIADEAIEDVTDASNAAIAAVIAEGNEQVVRVEQEGNEQVYRVEAAGAAITGIVSPIIIAENTFGTKGSVELWNPETPPDYVRTAGHSTAGDGGGALYKMVGSEPTHEGKIQSADGTWWELCENTVTLEMFGGRADGGKSGTGVTGTDNLAAMNAALGYGLVNTTANYGATAAIQLGRGKYSFSGKIKVDHNVKITGASGWANANALSGTVLYFPQNTIGFYFLGFQTPDPDTAVVTGKEAAGAILENVRIESAAMGSDLTKHGIVLKTKVLIRNCIITVFSGDGINIEAQATVAPFSGNANLFIIEACRLHGNGGSGIYVDGSDANAGTVYNCDGTGNGRWGFHDRSFLGNNYIGCHTQGDGVATVGNNGATKSAVVHFGGNRYAANPAATEADYVSTTPGTDANVWIFHTAGGVHPFYPQWVAAQPVGTYFSGGGYKADILKPGSRSVFLGCYTENDVPGNDIGNASVVIGGPFGRMLRGSALVGNNGGQLISQGVDAGFATRGSVIESTVGGDDSFGSVLFWREVNETAAWAWKLHYSGGDWLMSNANGVRIAMRLTGEHTTQQMGTGAVVPYIATFPVIGLGSSTNTRRQTTAATIPAVGTWAKGDVVWNTSVVAGGSAGWICTTAGTPGTWKTFGAVSA